MRRSTVLDVGNFNPLFTHTEDAELGSRLSKAGFDIAFDPSLIVNCNIQNSIDQVLERYWRWYAGSGAVGWEFGSWISYFKNIVYSVKVMAWQDIVNGDLGASSISLICPHYQFWKPRIRNM
jgi:GT2 family glycosyltransferase